MHESLILAGTLVQSIGADGQPVVVKQGRSINKTALFWISAKLRRYNENTLTRGVMALCTIF
ncbi:hypothetical protein SODG_006312 [Sodalis praecaptivus]